MHDHKNHLNRRYEQKEVVIHLRSKNHFNHFNLFTVQSLYLKMIIIFSHISDLSDYCDHTYITMSFI
jgi:hypothetical protein